MSYEPTNWKSGDVVTSAKLNKLEQGVANAGGLVQIPITVDENEGISTLGKTGQELIDMFLAGQLPYILFYFDSSPVIGVFRGVEAEGDGAGHVTGYLFSFNNANFTCTSLSDYPTG